MYLYIEEIEEYHLNQLIKLSITSGDSRRSYVSPYMMLWEYATSPVWCPYQNI